MRDQADRALTTSARLRSKCPPRKRHYETSDELERGDVRELPQDPRVGDRRDRAAGGNAALAAPRTRGLTCPNLTGLRQMPHPSPSARAAAVPGPGIRAPTAPPPTWPLPLTAPPGEPRRRQSRADRAHARQEEDRARREAEAAGPLPLPDLDQLEAAHRASHRGLTP